MLWQVEQMVFCQTERQLEELVRWAQQFAVFESRDSYCARAVAHRELYSYFGRAGMTLEMALLD